MIKKISLEKLICRTPSLFPYIEEDEYGVCHLHHAIESENGSYGKVIPNFMINNGDSLYYKSYYDLKKCYYDNECSVLTEAINRGFGKFEVNSNITGELVPKFMYYPNIKDWIEWFEQYINICENYVDSSNKDICCICKEFDDRGGVDMYMFLKNLYNECLNISNEWYTYALNYYNEKKTYGSLSFNICISSKIDDMGIETEYAKEWVKKKGYNTGDICIYNDNSYILGEGFYGDSKNYGIYDEESNEVYFDFDNWKRITNKEGKKLNIEGSITLSSESKLVSLRRTKRYFFINNDEEVVNIPSENENLDMLCLYQKGMVLNVKTIVDNNGNIAYYGYDESFYLNGDNNLYDANNENIKFLSDGEGISESEYEEYSKNLIAYGDCITNIYFNEEENELNFEYCIGAHLIGEGINVSERNNIFSPYVYTFSNFIIDENYSGIKYVETYKVDEDFEYDFNKTPDENANEGKYGYFKTIYTKKDVLKDFSNNQVINTERTCDNIESDLSRQDFIYSQNIRKEEFMGVTFNPIVEKDILIDRGTNAAFEKHLKLGEVKTMEDLENYSNGSFFVIKKINE